MREVAVVGVGIHPFGRFGDKSYVDMGIEAVEEALKDANMEWKEIQVSFCAAMYLPATTGVRVLNNFGRTGIPVCDVEAACASGAVALRRAWESVAFGSCDQALALGVEKMPRGFMDPSMIYEDWQIKLGMAVNPMYWGVLAQRHMHDYGTTEKQLAMVSVKNHRHAVHNPNAMYRKELSLEEVLHSPLVCDPLRLLMLCAPDEGAAAIVLCAREIAHKYNAKPITIAATAHGTSLYPWFRGPSFSITANPRNLSVSAMVAQKAYEDSGIGPADLDVVELQDSDSFSEIALYEELGLCEKGRGGELVESGATQIGGKIPVNPSGGLLSKGEPVGASHLGQVHEIVLQLQGRAGRRQVEGAKVGMAQVIGAGGNAGVTILKR